MCRIDDGPMIFGMIVNTPRDTAAAIPGNRWDVVLTEGHASLVRARRIFRHLPSAPRCKVCNNPFGGPAGRILSAAGFRPSRKNPNLCSRCCDALPPGGAEVDVAVLFADVRGSTALGQQGGASDFAAVLNRFYTTATQTLLRHDAVLDKLIGDEVMAFFVRGISGPHYRRNAVLAGMDLLEAIGYGSAGGPWLELGVAVNAGVAYVGNVGGSVVDFTALGDPVNAAARMQGHAAAGELLVASGVADDLVAGSPSRPLPLRGYARPLDAFVLGARGVGQATASRRRTPSCSGRSGSILMPSSSQVP
jgi:adenylate cyclase